MKKLVLTLSVLMLGTTSCMTNQKNTPDKDEMLSLEPPKTLDDDWTNWLVGSWQGTATSDIGPHKNWVKADCRMDYELVLNGQFLQRKARSKVTALSDEYVKYLKDTSHLSDAQIDDIRSSSFESMEVYTIDPKTGDIVAYLFDSLRCVAEGTGPSRPPLCGEADEVSLKADKRQGAQEIINWDWSVCGRGTSTRTTTRLSEDEFTATEEYLLPDGRKMLDTIQMTRIRD
jgi:hypothetical protein